MGRRLFLEIDYDQDVSSPCDDDMFKLYSFSSKHASYCDPEKLPFSTDELEAMLMNNQAWLLDYYEHGMCCWSLSGSGPQCQWDTSRRCGILIWEGKPEDLSSDPAQRTKSAASFCETYTDWCNGNCFWYRYWLEEADEFDAESCGGMIGDEHLLSVLNDEVLKDDDTIVLVSESHFDYTYIRDRLKGRVLKTSYFPTQPQPEYFI